MNKAVFSLLTMLCSVLFAYGQDTYWQQQADYKMNVDLDVKSHKFTGDQEITYTNNSPDTLDRLYFHLYFNAFQPNSMMDVRSRNIVDPDSRVGDRISKLSKDEEGHLHLSSLMVDGKDVVFTEEGTILVAYLKSKILPNTTVVISTKFTGQVPKQIRRSGRDNAEGISYSMTQWYPKLSEYDVDGWHPNPYIGREFYGIWGDWEVSIAIDGRYRVGATGQMVSNPKVMGRGLMGKARYTFKAKHVHDFAWAADPDYTLVEHTTKAGTQLKLYFQPGEETTENWSLLPRILDEAEQYMNKHFGEYPYPVYSIIQGGDGGMEYPMATLITGKRSLPSLVGVSIHEWMHSWYQMVLGTDEAQYPWMDEGFTSYATSYTMNHLRGKGLLPGDQVDNPMRGSIDGLGEYSKSEYDEPITTHADHYSTNTAYSVASYTKGSVFLEQLKYIIGTPAFDRTMLRYFNEWKYKHPTPRNFIRVAEKESGMILDWYLEYWMGTTKYPNYGIQSVSDSHITLVNNGKMPMPLEIIVTEKDNTKSVYYIPLRIMRGEKVSEYGSDVPFYMMEDWRWTSPTYELKLKDRNYKHIAINPLGNFVDTDRSDNEWPFPPKEEADEEENEKE